MRRPVVFIRIIDNFNGLLIVGIMLSVKTPTGCVLWEAWTLLALEFFEYSPAGFDDLADFG